MIVVVMGVSGSGKTEIGRRLAARLGCGFIEGDDFHPPANVAKPASLLKSQFATLEPPRHAIEADVRESVEDCVDSIAARLAVAR